MKLSGHMVEKVLDCSNYCSVATFAVKYHFDSLLPSCVIFMECFADIIVDDDLGIVPEPMHLPVLIMFLKSDELDVLELKLLLE